MMTPAGFKASNVFGNLIFPHHVNDTVLVSLAILIVFIILPSAVEQQRLCRYLASVQSETDSIPCYHNLIGVFLPWVLAAIFVHAQNFVSFLNFTTLICLALVSINCSLVMWSLQLDECA